ncbi:neurofilament heavy polypeptide-like [Limulus polyphemus]|uniref:Neurofilament heavy polypeptide-like n=1 Tax=Limulus polyphemus TaxID=6850 RepID=A0ABM1C3A4_LIMPO|nr:neurofilament heavy polypeptide-like [Limulus polyphemus]
MKPNNPVGPKKSGISVESKTPNIFTGTSLADRKKHSIPADTMKPTSRDESKKSTISDESKKFPSPDDSKELSSPVECDKLSSPDESKELSSSNKPKKISSPDESKKLTNPDESKELTSADEYKQLTKSNEYNILCSPNESKKFTNSAESKKLINSAESKKPSSSAEPKKFTSLIESKKLTSPSESKKLTSSAESKKVASPAETTKLINLAETKKLASLQEVRKNSNLTETKKLITPTEVNNSTNPIEIKKLSSEPPTIKTTEVNATHLAPTVSSSFSSLVSTTEAPKNQDLTSEVFPAVLGEKAGRHLTTSLQKVPKFSFNEDSKVSWHHEIIEKKSRKDSELKISNSPEFLITKPREIPPIKISRKLSIKIVDHDRLELKEDSEVDSGVGSDVSSRPETQLSVEDDLWSPTNSTPEIEKPATPSKPSLTPPPTPSPSTSNPCPSPNAGYSLCPTPLHVPSISPKLCLSPREENEPQRDDIGALDLSLSHRHEIRHRDRSSQPRSRHVANPPVLDKHRQLICLPAPTTPQLKRPPPPPVPHTHMYNRKGDSGRNHRFKGSTLTVINPDPNSYHPKLVIKNLDPRPDHSHHHHNHRM